MFGVVKTLFNRISGKREVGCDLNGNKFFVIEQHGKQTKKIVEYVGDPDPESIHPLWRFWLRSNKRRIPTLKDLHIWEEEQRQLKIRVKELDEADAKLRLEEIAQRQREGRDGFDDYTPLSFVQQLQERYSKDADGINTNTSFQDEEARFGDAYERNSAEKEGLSDISGIKSTLKTKPSSGSIESSKQQQKIEQKQQPQQTPPPSPPPPQTTPQSTISSSGVPTYKRDPSKPIGDPSKLQQQSQNITESSTKQWDHKSKSRDDLGL